VRFAAELCEAAVHRLVSDDGLSVEDVESKVKQNFERVNRDVTKLLTIDELCK
jgi:hypothetical protein